MRPPLALERLTESSHGQRLFELAHSWADGTTHLLLDPPILKALGAREGSILRIFLLQGSLIGVGGLLGDWRWAR